jgi:hypothetical protein
MHVIMVQELGLSAKGFVDPMTQKNTPKSVEEIVVEVMKTYEVVDLFQTLAIVSLNMGNLTIEENTLKIRLVTREKDKAVL